MPGFLKSKDISSNFIFSNGTEIYSEKFYGLDYEETTSVLTINEVDDKSEIITLPAQEESFDEEYLYWLWSGTQLKFYWDTTDPGRLLMEVT